MALDEFMAEARRRGFVPVPRGGWERICAQLDAQAEKVEGFTNLATHLFAKNGEALREAAVAEQEASVLAQVLVGGEIQALERYGDYDNSED